MEQDVFPNVMVYYFNFSQLIGPWLGKQRNILFYSCEQELMGLNVALLF